MYGQNSQTDRQTSERVEQHILKFSVCGSGFFALLGLIWGILARSQMVIFDGLYSSISVVLSSLSIYAAQSMKIGDDMKFPLGRSLMEPMVIACKSIVLVALCVMSFSKAAITLFTGGRETDAISAMTYAFIATVGCLACMFYIIWKRKKTPSSLLVKAEYLQWGMDTLLSSAVLLGFFIASAMQHMGYGHSAKYIDPLMVVVISAYFLKMPAKSLIESIKDLLRMAPDGNIYNSSRKVIEEIAKNRGFESFNLRISKVGRQLTYKIGFVSHSPKDERSMGELDNIREEVETRLKALFDNTFWLGISFMYDKKWG